VELTPFPINISNKLGVLMWHT